MLTKTYQATLNALDPAESDQGIVEMIVSTYDVDSWGDRVVPGAFADTLADWKSRGDPIPFIWSHQHDDPDSHIGIVLDAAEREVDAAADPPAPAGLWVKAQLDLDNPKSKQVLRLLKGRRVTQASFAYDIVDGGAVTENEQSVYELRKLQLYEVGPTLIGMNQATELLGAKDYRVLGGIMRSIKAGRVISAKNEELLRAAHESIGAVLSALDSDDGKANPGEPAKVEEPSQAKTEEPMRSRVAELATLEHNLRFSALGL